MERVDVLEKVKKLFLIPGMDVMTVKQVAEYFQVDTEVIKKVYQNNKDEIESDGTIIKSLLISKEIRLRNGRETNSRP